jgi:putative ABC transport system substrate-binding protein
VAQAQQPSRIRRIGVLMSQAPDNPSGPVQITAFAQGLQALGWTAGSNLRIDYRWGANNTDLFRRYATELVALAPDVILATAGSIVGALQQASRTVPIVFVTTIDPVGSGFVQSLARPGGNATGFTAYEFSIGGKWLELLKEIAPGVTRVAVIRDPSVQAGTGGFAAIQAIAPSFGVELTPVGVHDADEIEHGITAFARRSNGGMVTVGPPSSLALHSDLIIALAARYRLPAVYSLGFFAAAGGLISYGADSVDQFRARDAKSVYLRAWGETFHHSLQLTRADAASLGHVSWRAESEDALEAAAADLSHAGLGDNWIEGGTGHGKAYRFRTPSGHVAEIFWQVERYAAAEDVRSRFRN